MALIDFDGVRLRYPVRENHGTTLEEMIVRGLFRRQKRAGRKYVDALNGITFRAGEGDRVAIIGRNGAGKSTLLRAIAGVYPVTGGHRRVRGDICSLFDISVGFEYEATGWQNLRYRCYLQGDSPAEVRAKARSIVDFSELGEFMDLPLRCYSTGMAMRLAFAIATSSRPDVLLEDEVFATGDLEFHRKAEARMKEFMQRASIVVMVGHDLRMLETVCERALWVDQGRVRMDGPVRQVVEAYVRETEGAARAA